MATTKKPDIPRHPAYGYATAEQIEKLRTLGVGPDYYQLLKQIQKQHDKRGRIE